MADLEHLIVALSEPDEHTLRILVATDNHLGYLEKDPIRGEDSFRSFEEIFQIAVERKVCLNAG